MNKLEENKQEDVNKNKSSIGSLIFWVIISIIFICSLFTECGNTNSEEQNQMIRNIRDSVYELFIPNVFDKIRNTDYYYDVQYRIDSFEVEFNNKVANNDAYIKFDISPSGGLYETTWMCFLNVYSNSYPLFYMTIKFSSSMQVSKLSRGTYLVDGK